MDFEDWDFENIIIIYFLAALFIVMGIVLVEDLDHVKMGIFCFIMGSIILICNSVFNVLLLFKKFKARKRSCLKSFSVDISDHVTEINRGFEKRNISSDKLRGLLYFSESRSIEVFYIGD